VTNVRYVTCFPACRWATHFGGTCLPLEEHIDSIRVAADR
jgi:hypothetical protein